MQNPDSTETQAPGAEQESKQVALQEEEELVEGIAGYFDNDSTAPAAVRSESTSQIGGVPQLPSGVSQPCDRAGKPMHMIAQINFAELPGGANTKWPNHGLFFLFWNATHDRSNPKDRHAFRCIWVPEFDSNDLTRSEQIDSVIGPGRNLRFGPSSSKAADYTDKLAGTTACPEIKDQLISHTEQVQLFGHPRMREGKKFSELQEIAAFAGNGVSWSAARRNDSCYSHLVENAQDWNFFLQVSFIPELSSELGANSFFLLIRNDDFKQQNYDKAWLLFA